MIISTTVMLALAVGFAQDATNSNGQATPPTETTTSAESVSARSEDRVTEAMRRLRDSDLTQNTPSKVLWQKLVETTATMLAVRREVAQARMELSGLQRELDDLRQFILDHDTYGPDYTSYKKVLEETKKQRRAEAARAQREKDDANRRRRMEVKQRLDAAKGREELEKLYDERGFAPIGQDVYTARSAFFYAPIEGEDGRTVQYRPTRLGTLRPVTVPSNRELNYSTMTISGSVLNGDTNIRSIGVAFTFFDESGNQVGAQIIEIENARPNVPYPFTRKIDMALNRPFHSHSTYVLYADQVQIP
ncbi:MAG: hypothetical protein MK116_10765 [Phycisphaerales bacterium]|nr:hypothetical protein [Phycisphaerales bacterium]